MKIVIIGGTGLIGPKPAGKLREHGHEAVAAAPNTGVNAFTREGLAEALAGASVVIDVSNPPSFADDAVMEFFETTTRNLLAGLASAGVSVMRYGLAADLLWIGALKFHDYEVKNIEPIVTSSPLISPLRHKLGAKKLARLIGATEITLGALIAARPFAPRVSAVGSVGAVGMFLVTLSFLATTPEAWQEGEGMPNLSVIGQSLSKDGVLLGASLLTAAESLRAARHPRP